MVGRYGSHRFTRDGRTGTHGLTKPQHKMYRRKKRKPVSRNSSRGCNTVFLVNLYVRTYSEREEGGREGGGREILCIIVCKGIMITGMKKKDVERILLGEW